MMAIETTRLTIYSEESAVFGQAARFISLRLRRIAAGLILVGLLPLSGYALTPVPTGLPAKQSAALNLRYKKLSDVKTALNLRIDQFETKCASVPIGSSLVGECVQEQTAIRIAKADYGKQADMYERDLAAAIHAELKEINHRIPITRKELERLTPQLLGFQAAVDEWTNLAEDAREKARHTAKDVVVSVLLERLALKKEAAIRLGENSLRKINVLLRSRSFLPDLYAQVLTVERLQSLKTDLDVIKLLKTVQGTMIVGTAIESENREDGLRAALKIIEMASHDPHISLLIADGEITIDAAYGWLARSLARERVNQLLELNESQFKSVQTLTTLYKSDIDNRKALLAAL